MRVVAIQAPRATRLEREAMRTFSPSPTDRLAISKQWPKRRIVQLDLSSVKICRYTRFTEQIETADAAMTFERWLSDRRRLKCSMPASSKAARETALKLHYRLTFGLRRISTSNLIDLACGRLAKGRAK